MKFFLPLIILIGIQTWAASPQKMTGSICLTKMLQISSELSAKGKMKREYPYSKDFLCDVQVKRTSLGATEFSLRALKMESPNSVAWSVENRVLDAQIDELKCTQSVNFFEFDSSYNAHHIKKIIVTRKSVTFEGTASRIDEDAYFKTTCMR